MHARCPAKGREHCILQRQLASVLLIWHTRAQRAALASWLARLGHAVTTVASTKAAARLLDALAFDLVFLGPVCSARQAQELTRWLHSHPQSGATAIIVAVQGDRNWPPPSIDAPVDAPGVITVRLPIHPARLEEALREALSIGLSDALRRAGVRLDRDILHIEKGGRTQRLTRKEFQVLEYLDLNSGRTVSHDELLEQVWGFHPGTGGPEIIRAHMRNIRRKLRQLGAADTFIETMSGYGYRLA